MWGKKKERKKSVRVEFMTYSVLRIGANIGVYDFRIVSILSTGVKRNALL